MTGPAPRVFAAAGACERRHVTPARDAEDHRTIGGERRPRRVERDFGDARRPGHGVACDLPVVVGDRLDTGAAGADRRAVGDEVVRPARDHQRLRLGGPGEPAEQQAAPLVVRPQHRHLAGMRVGRPWVGHAVVAVIPHDDQAQVLDRREHRASGTDHQLRGTAAHGQPSAVARGGSESGGQRDPTVADQRLTLGPHPIEITLIGNDEDAPASPCEGRRGEFGETARPVLPR